MNGDKTSSAEGTRFATFKYFIYFIELTLQVCFEVPAGHRTKK
jgi:hypothetical protein